MEKERLLKEYRSTPIYYYERGLLERTLACVTAAADRTGVHVHYAVKANSNKEILKMIAATGVGADCVSIGEMKAAIDAGFAPESIMFAGVGKRESEIAYAIEQGIGWLNVESIEELEVIARIAREMGKQAPVALRINPDIDAHTHHYITTGLQENKFGIDMSMRDLAIGGCKAHSDAIRLRGLHFHIGSQITTLEPYKILCERINKTIAECSANGVHFESINVGGGLGIDYDEPDAHPIPDFDSYFDVFKDNLKVESGCTLHCEPGRAIVGQCGSLITRVLYVKRGVGKTFVIVDAGMNDLIRPALYQARHKVENISSTSSKTEVYDVVGPVCESSDCFGEDLELLETRPGDLIAIRSAGAYGSIMASRYNLREFAPEVIL